MGDSLYIHGTAPEEQQRLSLLNRLLNNPALERLNLKGGEKILDVGSGLGQFTRAMARKVVPSGIVVGVERSLDQLNEAKRLANADQESGLVDFRQGSATALPLRREEWGSFDLVHTRFLLEHVTDPLAVVRMMVEAARTGGRVILQDDDHDVMRLFPEPDGFYQLWNAYIRSYHKMGNDPYVGRRLVSLLHQSGADPIDNHWFFFGSCSGHPLFSSYVTNLIGVLQTAREPILRVDLLNASLFDSTIEALEEWQTKPDSAIWYSVCWAEGLKRT